MTHPSILFTDIEVEVLHHRLAMLEQMDADDLEELFEDSEPADIETYAGRVAEDIKNGRRVIALDVPVAAAVLADAVEGGTLHEMAQESFEAGDMTKQKVTAYRNAYHSLANKLAPVVGRPLILPNV